MNQNAIKGLVAAVALSFSALSAASVIYNNGAPNQASGNEMTQWIQSEDFTLAAATNITDIHFWSVDHGLTDGTISWAIYGDNAGAPGAVLTSGNTAVARTATGNVLSFGSEFENDFNISSFLLSAGTYHLGLHNGALGITSRSEFYWETTAGNATTTGMEDNAPFDGVWSNNGQEHAFFLTGGGTTVPEPASLALLGIGLLGLGSMRRKSRA